jgi:hypothetical protein
MLRQLLLIAGLGAALGCGAARADEAGRVVFVSGKAQLAQRAAALDAAVQEGDELSTGADGYIYVKTADDGFLILRPNSRARISAYHIDAANPANTRVKLELLGGVARSISGQGVKRARQNFRFNTPVAAIGVRGTDFIVYTDQQTSRVAVVSGGVVMSAFGGACGPEGGGPCEGGASRELFAGQAGALLQVQRGQHLPQLLHSPALAPDVSAPPRGDEPVGKVGAAGTLPVGELSLEARKGEGEDRLVARTPPAAPPVTAPPEVVVKSAPEVLWGRWQSVAGKTADRKVLDKLEGGAYGQAMIVGPYAVARLKDAAFVMPHDGQASFALIGSEVALQKGGKAATLAVVENAHLDIDFGNRTFATGMTVVGQGLRVPVAASGDVTMSGELVSSRLSDTTVRGYLGGAQAAEAGYVFKNVSTPNLTVMGATTWSR